MEHLENVIVTAKDVKKESDFELLPEGRHKVGLVKIELKFFPKWINGVKTQEEEQKYQLSFRSYENPKAWFFIKFRPIWKERSTMFAIIDAISDRRFDEDSNKQEVFDFLKSLHDCWFQVRVKKNEYGFCVLANNSAIELLEDADAPSPMRPTEFFKVAGKRMSKPTNTATNTQPTFNLGDDDVPF